MFARNRNALYFCINYCIIMRKETIKLYGFIYSWNSNSAIEFINRLNDLDSKGLDVIDLHIHSFGGDVIEGFAIFNAIRNCKTPVDIYIDGLSASMATIIMLAGRNIYMSENAFIMIHAPSGFVDGTVKDMAKCIKLLKEMEANFKRVYSVKTGKTEAEVAQWLDGDNWFSAKQALADQLIDGIVDIVDNTLIVTEQTVIDNTTPRAMYQRYTALAKPDNEIINKNKTPNNQNIMDKQAVINRYGLTDVTADSTDEQIYAAIDKKLAASETALATEKEKQVTAVVAAAKTAGKITDRQVPQFEAIGKNAGIEALQTALDAIKPYQPVSGTLDTGKDGKQDSAARASWDWEKWQKEDPRGLEAMAKSDNAAFTALFDAKYKRK